MRRHFNELFLWPVSQEMLPEDIVVKDVFSLGSTRSARELMAVAHTPASRMVRGLGIQTENPAATVMLPDTKGHLMGLLSLLLRRFLTPWHVPVDIPYDSWFRTVVLPIAAMEDGHLVAAISAVSLAIATGKPDLSRTFRRGQEQNCCHPPFRAEARTSLLSLNPCYRT